MCLQQECTSEVEVWHDNVRFYKIFNKNGNTVVLSVLRAGVLTVLEFTRIDEVINIHIFNTTKRL